MATTKITTMQDGMVDILSTLGAMKAAPDADQQFLDDLSHVLVAKLHQGASTPQNGPGGPSPAGGGGGGPVAGPGPSPSPQSGQQPTPGMSPMATGGQPPQPGQSQMQGQPAPGQGVMAKPGGDINPDELRRMLITKAGH